MLSMFGLIGGLALLIFLTMRGMNLLIVGPISALFVALFSGMPLFPQLAEEGAANFVGNYMAGFSGFVTSWYLMFLLGAIFGKVMEDSGAADSVSEYIVGKFGMKYAVLAIVIACAVLTYGGVSFVRRCILRLSNGTQLVQTGGSSKTFHPCCAGIWVGNLYDDFCGISGNPKLDPD